MYACIHIPPTHPTPLPPLHTMADAYNSLVSAAENPDTAASVYAGSAARLVDVMRGRFYDTSNAFADQIPHLPKDMGESIVLDLTNMRRRLKIIVDVTTARIETSGDDAVWKGIICEEAGKKIAELFRRLKELMEKTVREAPEDQETCTHVARIRALIPQCIDTWE